MNDKMDPHRETGLSQLCLAEKNAKSGAGITEETVFLSTCVSSLMLGILHVLTNVFFTGSIATISVS